MLSLALFVWQRHFGYNLADGGFLWYDAQQTLKGNVPIRDFMAYDPGRYWITAAFMAIAHDNGMVTLRASLYFIEAIGLVIAAGIVARAQPRPAFSELVIVVLTAALWMYPEHKLFDITLSIAIVAVLAALVSNPGRRQYFLAGLYVGLSAIIGRNHGVYSAVASALAVGYLLLSGENARTTWVGAAWGVIGMLVGYAPIFILAITAPGYLAAVVESVRFLFEYKGTNLPLPVPWPWLVSYHTLAPFEALRQTLIGIGFVALPLFSICGVAKIILMRRKHLRVPATFVAAVLASIPYQHYAFSRADVGHLAHSVFPMMLGLLCWPSAHATRKYWVTTTLFVISAIVMVPLMPRVQAMHAGNWQRVQIGHEQLMVDPGTAQAINFLREMDRRYSPGQRTFYATPLWPGAYPAFDKQSPTWESYALFPRSKAFQEAEIERIRRANPGFVVITDFALDGRDELRFRRTHPMVEDYIAASFQRIVEPGQPPGVEIYVAPQSVASTK